MKTTVLLILAAMLASCMTANKVLDKAGDVALEEFAELCDSPDYRSAALGMLANGRLAQENAAIVKCCGDDRRQICVAVRAYYKGLLDSATR